MAAELDQFMAIMGRTVAEHRQISGLEFVQQELPIIALGPATPPDASVVVTDCRFIRCVVSPGEAAVRQGVLLRDVTFDSLVTFDSMTVSTNAVLDRVVFTGTPRKGGLWIRPDEEFDARESALLKTWVTEMTSAIDWMVDISGYEAEHVEVLGLPLDKVLWSPDRHVAVDMDLQDHDEWERLNLDSDGFWELCVDRLETFEVVSGIFGLPLAGEGNHRATREQVARFIEAGLIALPPKRAANRM